MFTFKESNINFKQELGSGAFGTVYPYQKGHGDDKWVMKVQNSSCKKLMPIIQEIVLGFSCDHPNVLPIRGFHIDYNEKENNYKIYIKMRRMAGSLKSKLKERAQQSKLFSEAEIIDYFYDIVCGLEYLHSKKIAHRDIKLDNILLNKNNTAVISDFGIVKFVGDESSYLNSDHQGALSYLAPEVLDAEGKLKKAALYKADIWSLGVIIIKLHYSGEKKEEELVKKLNGLKGQYSDFFINLLKSLIKHNPDTRCTIHQIKQALEENYGKKSGKALPKPGPDFVSNKISVSLRNLMGNAEQLLDIGLNDSISEIKKEIQKHAELNEQCLVFRNRMLEDHRKFLDYVINDNEALYLYHNHSKQDLNFFHEKDLVVNLNIIHGPRSYPINSLLFLQIKELKERIASLTSCQDKLELLYEGKALLRDECTLYDYKITNNSNIFSIPNLILGSSLKFMQIIQYTETKDLAQLKSSLGFLEQKDLNEFWLHGFERINKRGCYATQYLNDCQQMAISLWDSLLYREVNQDLRETNDLSKWNIYLKHLLTGLKLIPSYAGIGYRGVRNYQDLITYQKGHILRWQTIPSLSKTKRVAELFSNPEGTIFEVLVVFGRDVSQIRDPFIEDEFMVLPDAQFEVMEVVKAADKPLLVRLREIPLLTGSKIVFWIHDHPQSISSYGQELAKKDVDCVFCTSTEHALAILNHSIWVLSLDHIHLRFVTNMVRHEKGVRNTKAGIEFIKKLSETYEYRSEVLIYCDDEDDADQVQKSCLNAGIQGSFKVTRRNEDLLFFINFL